MEVLRGTVTVKQFGLIRDKTFENQLCILYYGVQTLSPRIDMYDRHSQNQDMVCKKTIYIESASWKKIDAIVPALSFAIDKGGQRYSLIFSDNEMRRGWLLSLCCISHGLFASKHVVGVDCEGVIHPSSIAKDESLDVTPERAPIFFVLADQSDACYNLGLKGIFNLIIRNGTIVLSPITGNMSVQWNIKYLRTYGFSTHTVFIYAGSRSSTGEGKFIFRTAESKKINDSIDEEAASMDDINTGTASSNSVSSFAQQLGQTLDSNRPPLARTVSNKSSDSGHVKQDKKIQKKLQKEQKRKEEEERKIQKQREKEEKKDAKRKEEEERKAKRILERQQRDSEEQRKKTNNQRKASQAVSLPSEPEGLYADAEEDNDQPPPYSQVSLDGEYAQAGDFTARSQPVQPGATTDQIYLEPWESKALPSRTDEQVQQTDDIESIYAQPSKDIRRPRPPANDSYPPEDSSTYIGLPPAIIPPKFVGDDSSGDSGNIYAHTNEVPNSATVDCGDVYGIGSASEQFVPKKGAVDDSANIYDNF